VCVHSVGKFPSLSVVLQLYVTAVCSNVCLCLQVEVSPRTTCWPGSSLLIMALSFSEKQSWVFALEAVVQGHNSNVMEMDRGQPARYQGSSLLCLDRPDSLDLNCCLQLSPEVQFCVRFEVSTVVFWDVAQCHLVSVS
jgi:hypothetical protein